MLIPTSNTCIYSHKLCLVGSQNPVGEHAVKQVGKIAPPGRKTRQESGHRAQACAQARCPLTKIKCQAFNFEILSFQFSSFNFQFSKIRRFKTKFQNGDIQISIPTSNTCIYSHKLCFVGSQNPVCEHAVRQVGKIASPGRKARYLPGHRAQACAQARCSLTKIKFQAFNFEILSLQFSSFNFQLSKSDVLNPNCKMAIFKFLSLLQTPAFIPTSFAWWVLKTLSASMQ